MTKISIKNFNQDFSINEKNVSLCFEEGDGGIPLIKIENTQANATISLQGVHVLSWIPINQNEVIWVSEVATFSEAKSVRGGIPICWPWFGAHESNDTFPAHGFARTVMWQVTETQHLSDDETLIVFQLNTGELDEKNKALWPINTNVEYRVSIGKKLALELITHNQSKESITIGQALHTYFNVDDVRKTVVAGLEGRDYLDKPQAFKRLTQKGNVTINEEVDRVYLDTPDDVVIDDSQRKIKINKQGSNSTIVWNPWEEVADKMGDLGSEGYLKMLCVESANACEDVVIIKPNEKHSLRVCYTVEQ